MTLARALLAVSVATLVLCGGSLAAAPASSEVELAPVTRLPFPERGYVSMEDMARELKKREINRPVRRAVRRLNGSGDQ